MASVLTELRNLIRDITEPARKEQEDLYPKFERRAVKIAKEANRHAKGPQSPGKLFLREMEKGLDLQGLNQALKMLFWRYGNAVRAEVVAELQAAGLPGTARRFITAWGSATQEETLSLRFPMSSRSPNLAPDNGNNTSPQYSIRRT